MVQGLEIDGGSGEPATDERHTGSGLGRMWQGLGDLTEVHRLALDDADDDPDPICDTLKMGIGMPGSELREHMVV